MIAPTSLAAFASTLLPGVLPGASATPVAAARQAPAAHKPLQSPTPSQPPANAPRGSLLDLSV